MFQGTLECRFIVVKQLPIDRQFESHSVVWRNWAFNKFTAHKIL